MTLASKIVHTVISTLVAQTQWILTIQAILLVVATACDSRLNQLGGISSFTNRAQKKHNSIRQTIAIANASEKH